MELELTLKLIIPPIKTQGIKTKLVPFIVENISFDKSQTWVEPFLGSGVVAFNVQPRRAILADINPHIINFYTAIQQGVITRDAAESFLTTEGQKLRENPEYYYEVRKRFNEKFCSYDFLFLSRSGFNGLQRYSKNGYNVPFCRKPERFSKSYVTKIANQIENVRKVIQDNDYTFITSDFKDVLNNLSENSFTFIDSPYAGRSSGYLTEWTDEQNNWLADKLNELNSKFAMTVWHSNKYRANDYLDRFEKFRIVTKDHFYHVGSKAEYRNKIVEALILN